FVTPVREISARGAEAYPLLIHVELELIVGAHVHDEVRGLLRKVNYFAKAQHDRVALRSVRMSDPLRAPHLLLKFGRVLGFGAERREVKIDQPNRENRGPSSSHDDSF